MSAKAKPQRMRRQDEEALRRAGWGAPRELAGHLARLGVQAFPRLREELGDEATVQRVLRDPRVFGERRATWSWMDGLVGLSALTAVAVCGAAVWGVRQGQEQRMQVVTSRALPAYHVLTAGDVRLQHGRRQEDALTARSAVIGHLTLTPLKSGQTMPKASVTALAVPKGAVMSVSVEGSLPPRLTAGRIVVLLVGQQQVRATLLAHRTVGTAAQADVLIALKDVATLSKGRAVVSVPVE